MVRVWLDLSYCSRAIFAWVSMFVELPSRLGNASQRMLGSRRSWMVAPGRRKKQNERKTEWPYCNNGEGPELIIFARSSFIHIAATAQLSRLIKAARLLQFWGRRKLWKSDRPSTSSRHFDIEVRCAQAAHSRTQSEIHFCSARCRYRRGQ